METNLARGAQYEASVRDARQPAKPFDLASIKPPRGEMDGSGKFSPNLYRWVKSWLAGYACAEVTAPELMIFRSKGGALWIGRIGGEGWFFGSRLSRVLTRGSRAGNFAVTPRQVRSFKPLPGFWRRYRRNGRCALDHQHQQYWATEDARWEVKRNVRSCRWCGKFKQRKRVRIRVTREKIVKWERVR